MRALIVGYGRMGHFHAKVLADLGYEIVTVDPRNDQADFPTITKARMADARHNGKGFAVAAVACPAEHLVSAAMTLAGTRMLIEKPFATNLQDAEVLTEFLEMRGAPVCVGFVERFNPKIRWLRQQLQDAAHVGRARFTRHSDRPSDSPLDLLSHDVDLARYLGFDPFEVEYDCRHNQAEKVRTIEVEIDNRWVWVDLMDHDMSPLHALWHTFLKDEDYPTPRDALAVLRTVDMMQIVRAAL